MSRFIKTPLFVGVLTTREKEINEKAKKAFDEIKKKKGTNAFTKTKDKFIKKWSKVKEHKGSQFVLKLVEKVKNM